MNSQSILPPAPWARLINMHVEKKDINFFNETNEDQTDVKWKISRSPNGEIFLKNISASYLQIDGNLLKVSQEKLLFGGERICLNKYNKKSNYVFCVMNFHSGRDESREKLLKMENELRRELTCSICTNILQNCMILAPCQHSVCSFCLFGCLKSSNKCPLCRSEAKSVTKNPVLMNVIQLIEDNFPSRKMHQEGKELEQTNSGGTIVRNEEGVYLGSYVNGKKDGQGKMIYKDSSVYEGSWKNDKAEGEGTMVFKNAGRYDGNWADDRKHGAGKYTWIRGQVYEGNYEKGFRNGYGVMKYLGGGVYEGDWRNGDREGKGVMMLTKGDRYDGFWMNDKKHGAGKYIWSSGKEYEGNFQDDLFFWFGAMKYKDGRVYQGEWKNGKQHGNGKEICQDGRVRYEGVWQEGKFSRIGESGIVRKEQDETHFPEA